MSHRMTRSDMREHLANSYDADEMDDDTRAAILDEFDDEEDDDDLEDERAAVRDLIDFVQDAYPQVRRHDRSCSDYYDTELFWDDAATGRWFCLRTSTGWTTIEGFLGDQEERAWSVSRRDKEALGKKLRSPGYRRYLIGGEKHVR